MIAWNSYTVQVFFVRHRRRHLTTSRGWYSVLGSSFCSHIYRVVCVGWDIFKPGNQTWSIDILNHGSKLVALFLIPVVVKLWHPFQAHLQFQENPHLIKLKIGVISIFNIKKLWILKFIQYIRAKTEPFISRSPTEIIWIKKNFKQI